VLVIAVEDGQEVRKHFARAVLAHYQDAGALQAHSQALDVREMDSDRVRYEPLNQARSRATTRRAMPDAPGRHRRVRTAQRRSMKG
jgi:hypothetical protein